MCLRAFCERPWVPPAPRPFRVARTSFFRLKFAGFRVPMAPKKGSPPKEDDGFKIVTADDVELPFRCGVLTIYNWGRVDARPGFHTRKYMYPIGFKSSRLFQSYVDFSRKTEMVCEILDGGTEPIFRLTPADAPSDHMDGPSGSHVWAQLLRRVNERRPPDSKEIRTSISGPEYFGLSNQTVMSVLEFQEVSPQLQYYEFQYRGVHEPGAIVPIMRRLKGPSRELRDSGTALDRLVDRERDRDRDERHLHPFEEGSDISSGHRTGISGGSGGMAVRRQSAFAGESAAMREIASGDLPHGTLLLPDMSLHGAESHPAKRRRPSAVNHWRAAHDTARSLWVEWFQSQG